MDRHIQFQMICGDLIREWPLFNQGSDNHVILMEFTFAYVDPSTGIAEFFTVFSVCKTGIVGALVGNGAVAAFLITAIANIKAFIQSVTAFLFKIGACLVTGGTGG